MLRELTISQFAIIEHLQIEFDQGFHVLTGETGAGKSILIDALGLIMGGRSSAEYVRHGAKKAAIEALFEPHDTHPVWEVLRELSLEAEDPEMLFIRREVVANGKSTSRVNGRLVTVAMLKQIGQKLLDICGQHEHQSLLHVDEHLVWLDAFAGEATLARLDEYKKKYQTYRKVEQELTELNQSEQQIAEQVELYRFQQEEIATAALVVGEDEQLQQERHRLAYMEKLISHTTHVYNVLQGEGRGIDQVGDAMTNIESATEIDDDLVQITASIQTAYYQLEEAVRELGLYRDGLEFDPQRLNEVEERLHLIEQLKRKYGNTIPEIIQYEQQVNNKLAQLNAIDISQAELIEQRDQLQETCKQLADELTRLRRQAASRLESQLEAELKELNMGSTVFHVAFLSAVNREDQLGEMGQDVIQFQIAPNPGESLRPLHKIASGGELSRIMLALKCIFTDLDQSQTVIFDEIDTGVSGRTAQAIAERIAILSKSNQVLCVTHLPQVACMADLHYYIYKESVANQTKAFVKPLDDHQRTLELARMLGGVEVTETTRQHAEEMLQLAAQVKEEKTI